MSTDQRLLGPASDYPACFRRLFWTRELKCAQRFMLSLFAWCNGIHIELLLDVLRFCGGNITISRERHIRQIYGKLDVDEYYR